MTVANPVARFRSIYAWRELASWLFIPADVIWLAAWYCLMTGTVNGSEMVRNLGIFVLSSFLACLILRGLNAWKLSGAVRFILGVAGVLLGIWLGENLLIYQKLLFDARMMATHLWTGFSGLRSLSHDFWALIGMMFVWLRAILYIRKPVTQDTVLGRSQFGLVMLLIILLLPDRPGVAAILIGLSLFLVLSLSSLSLARIADINFYRGGKRMPFNLEWLVTLFGFALCLVAFAGSLAFLTSRWLGLMVLALTNGILDLLRFILEKLFLPLVMGLLDLVQKLLDLFYKPGGEIKVPEMNLEPPKMLPGLDPLEIEKASADVLRTAQPYILAILLGLVLVVVILVIIRKPWKEQLKEVDETLQEQIDGGFWKWLRKSFGLRIQNTLGSVVARNRFRRAAGLLRAARIRWIYHQFELHSTRKGIARPVAVTPLEYRTMVGALFPGGEDDLSLLTQAYLSVRYGELPESTREVTEVEEAWERLKTIKVSREIQKVRRLRKPR